MRRVVDPRNPCCENTCTAAFKMTVLVSMGRETYRPVNMYASGYLLTSYVWRWPIGGGASCLDRTDGILRRYRILACDRRRITSWNPLPAQRSWRPTVHEP